MEIQPTSIYVHIPFCQRKCLYCDFTSFAGREDLFDRYIGALKTEIRRNAERYPEARISTVYFGGGTPTVLSAKQLGGILEEIRTAFQVDEDAEISTEANPGSPLFRLPLCEGLSALCSFGFNRMSLGIQSFDASELRLLGRIHSAEEAVEGYHIARSAGFDNVSVDLMYGISRQTSESWRQTLREAVLLQPDHVSLYSLTVEAGTPFFDMDRRGELSLPGDDIEAEMYAEAIETLADAGFEHYEISNFCRPGRACRHNETYWRNEPYFGVGAGATSYLSGLRATNVGDAGGYVSRMESDESAVEFSERLDEAGEIGETSFLGLRMLRGIELASFERRYGKPFNQIFSRQVKDLTTRGLIEFTDGFVRLSKAGLMFADDVFVELIT
jgi:oxygen-independent coproporphyrinogen-3 oxidase